MNKTELCNAVAYKLEISANKAAELVNAVLDSISEALIESGSVTITGFGKFEARTSAARTGRNPKTGETVDIPARTVVKFKPGKGLKEQVS
jgi:nucleoid DNA-binding protein